MPDLPRLTHDALPWRTCVGIMLLNREGLVWVGRRRPKWAGEHQDYIWQMPQGGIEKFEAPRIAALRELREETGVTSVRVIGEHPQWLSYELPESLLGIALKGRFRGQRQKWFAMRFLGEDCEIDISPKEGAKAEFDTWKWVPLEAVPDLIVSFKREIYQRVAGDFAHLAQPLTDRQV
ncbi:RNA pyrophosphohydrolase [Hyphomicrobium sp. 99]|uniref:RNA pyrophosphohydrolase n=1 Tax=Hyphomicrobium sp. 99 TaxID=1163419 RepID=UPI0005F88690|nr:RNA pyrophosphohydrolase [Hyphomicrobium sp. 99]